MKEDSYDADEIAHILGETRRRADRQIMLDSTIVEAANKLETPITLSELLMIISASEFIAWGIPQEEVMESIGRILIGRWQLTDVAQEGLKNILQSR